MNSNVRPTGMPRGVYNNNPGNIRHGNQVWQGQALNQDDPAFVQFTTPEYGIRAIAKILDTYQRDGITTISQAIERWAPPSENDTDAYIAAVCSANNCSPGTPLAGNLLGVIKAIIQHENGEQPYTDDQINAGIALA